MHSTLTFKNLVGAAYNTAWHSNAAVLSEIGTLQVEFRYLAKITGRLEYATDAMRALDELLKIDTQDGLYPTLINKFEFHKTCRHLTKKSNNYE